MTTQTNTNRFEQFAETDVDGAVLRIGLEHYVAGPPSPAILINTGAVELTFRAHASDIDLIIDAFKAARRKMAAVQS